jgi:hypothetical protein
MRPERTLFLLVTCSRDAGRRDMAIEVVRNLSQKLTELDLSKRLVTFDNGSHYQEHFSLLPYGSTLCVSEENHGYWSAIKWVLDNVGSFIADSLDFIYIIESDLVNGDLAPLGECERFLEATPQASSVRTQEFSVRNRWRYDKRLSFLPFHVWRSQVSLRNAVTDERAWFKRAEGFSRMYHSNLHAKLPALHRLDTLKEVFCKLQAQNEISESDFFEEMMRKGRQVGVLDGGLYHSLASWLDRGKVVSGSYGSAEQLAQIGYLPTRKCRIQNSCLMKVDSGEVGKSSNIQ